MSTETDQPAAGGIPGLRYSEDSTGKKSLEFDGKICGLERVGETLVSSGPIAIRDGAPIRSSIDGPITISTFGDSNNSWWNGHTTNSSYTGNDYTDRSVIPADIPASGTNTFQANRSVCGLLWHGHNYRFIGNGGIPGQATSTMISRGAATGAGNRKSMYDVANLGARVCIVNALSINNLQSLPLGASYAAVDAMIADVKAITQYLASRHELLILSGIFGFNNTVFPVAQVDMIRQMIRYSHVKVAEIAAKYRNVVWVDPVGLTCDENASWLPGIADTSTTTHLHLGIYGAMVYSRKLRAILDARYDCKLGPSVVDTLYSWMNPSANLPAGVTLAAIAGGVLGTPATANGVLSVPFTTTADADGCQVLFGAIETWLSGYLSGDKFRVCYDYELLDSDGNLVSAHQAQSDVRLAVSGQGIADMQQPYCWVDGNRGLSTYVFALDRDASGLGTGSTAWLLIKPSAGAGSWTLKVYPPKVYKIP